MDETDQNRLTEGSVPRKMLAFALPIFLSNLFQQLYNAVDSLIVGNFIGSTALAAVGSSASMIMLLVGFINGVSLGAGVVIARFYGADDRENLSRALHTTVALGIAAGLVLTVVGVLLTPQILRWMGTPGDVIGNSIAYFRVYFLGSSAVVLYNMCASILQSVGDSRSPMKYLIFASLTNVVLDLLFVAVFRWGVASAALATILSQTLSALLAFRKLTHTGHSYRLSWRQVRFHGDMLRQVVYLGIPSGVQNSVISLANVIVQANINAFGSAAMAGCGAYSKIEGFAFLPVSCFSMALATFVSQNIGARRYDRVRSGIRLRAAVQSPAGRGHRAGHLRPLSPAGCRLQQQPGGHRLRRGRRPDRQPVLLPPGLLPLLCRHSPGDRAANHPHGYHAGHLVRPAHRLHHRRHPFHSRYSGDRLGLSADLVPGRPAVCRLPSPAPFPLRCRTGNVQIK